MITVEATPLSGVMVVTPQVFQDDRGFFLESFNAEHFLKEGLPLKVPLIM